MQGQIEIEVIYTNGDTAETDEQAHQFAYDSSKIISVLDGLTSDPDEFEINKVLRDILGRGTDEGAEPDNAYGEVSALLCDWAFNKLGWHDATVDIVGARIANRVLPIDVDTMDVQMWSLQLVREEDRSYMYFYQD